MFNKLKSARGLIAVTFLTLVSSPASKASPVYIQGLGGMASYNNGIGAKFTYGGGLGVKFGNFGVGGDFLTSTIVSGFTNNLILGNLRYYFGMGHIYIQGLAGVATQSSGTISGFTIASTSNSAFGGGLGIQAPLGLHFSIGAEGNYVAISNTTPSQNSISALAFLRIHL